MYRYFLKRILQIIPVIIGVSFLIFFIMDLAPGTAVDLLTAGDATPEQIAAIKHQYGYDRSVFYRYGKYMLNFLHGDLGTSYLNTDSVWLTYLERLPVTLFLSLGAFIVSVVIAAIMGIISAVRHGTLVDSVCMAIAMIGLAMPVFWLGLLLILVFSNRLGWLPSTGVSAGLKSYILPSITLGFFYAAALARTVRSSMLDVSRQDYLDTARSKGVSEWKILFKHSLRNALIPIITVMGTQVAATLGGAVVVESVFAMPGVGKLIVDSVNQRDVPMVTGSIVLTTALVSITLLIVDLLYAVIDPRIKAQYSRGGKRR